MEKKGGSPPSFLCGVCAHGLMVVHISKKEYGCHTHDLPTGYSKKASIGLMGASSSRTRGGDGKREKTPQKDVAPHKMG